MNQDQSVLDYLEKSNLPIGETTPKKYVLFFILTKTFN